MTAVMSWTNARRKQIFQYHRIIRRTVGSTDDPPVGLSDPLGPDQF